MILRLTMAMLLGLGLALTSMDAGANGPVAKLTMVEGEVEYSKDGEQWRAVKRNKYVFDGAHVRTGDDGSAVLVDSETGSTRTLAASSHITVAADGVEVLAGNLSEASGEGSAAVAALSNRFTKAVRYTTVRRSVKKVGEVTLSTPRRITLSASYPEMVWENVGPEFSYRLTIDGVAYDVPVASTAEMVRFTVPELAPGEHSYMVEIMDGDTAIYTPKRPQTLTWLDADAEAAYRKQLDAMQGDPSADEFVMAGFMEDHGFLVPAMDTYRAFFAEFPEENEMRPLLIKVYNDLKLKELKEKEAIAYNQLLLAEQGG